MTNTVVKILVSVNWLQECHKNTALCSSRHEVRWTLSQNTLQFVGMVLFYLEKQVILTLNCDTIELV